MKFKQGSTACSFVTYYKKLTDPEDFVLSLNLVLHVFHWSENFHGKIFSGTSWPL